MEPIDPAELSAYLDGELSIERAEEIGAALKRDPALRQSFESLAALDFAWKGQASTAAFRPDVQLPTGSSPLLWLAPAGVSALVLLRLGLKTQPPLLAAGVTALLLALFIVWGLKRLLEATDADRTPAMA